MLEPASEVAHGLGHLALRRIGGLAAGARVVSLVKDQKRSWTEVTQHGPERRNIVSLARTACDRIKFAPTAHGLAAKPRVRRVCRRCSRSTIVKSRPNFCAISSCHWRIIEAGAATMTVSMRRRSKSSRTIRPASTVFPKPTSSAISRLARGSASALWSGSSGRRPVGSPPGRALEKLSISCRGGTPLRRAEMRPSACGSSSAV